MDVNNYTLHKRYYLLNNIVFLNYSVKLSVSYRTLIAPPLLLLHLVFVILDHLHPKSLLELNQKIYCTQPEQRHDLKRSLQFWYILHYVPGPYCVLVLL